MIRSKSIFTFKSILFFVTILSTTVFGEGFLAGTLVKTPSGYTPIEQLQIGDEVVCYNFQGNCVSRPVTNLVRKNVDSYASILVGGERIFAADDHLFYLPGINLWVQASDLKIGDLCLQYCTETIAVDQVLLLYGEVEAYDISVDEYHNFCVSLADIHVHNQLDVAIEFAFEGGEVVFEGVAVLVAIGGAVVGWIAGSERSRPTFQFNGNEIGGEHSYDEYRDVHADNGKRHTEHPTPKPEKPKPHEPGPAPESKPNIFPAEESNKGKSHIFPQAENDRKTTSHAKKDDSDLEKIKGKGLPTGGDHPFVPPKNKEGEIPKDKQGRYIDRNGNAWKWDPKKSEWDVNHPSGDHTNVNSEGKRTHRRCNFPGAGHNC